MSAVPGDPYDETPYTDHAYAESHPDRLSVVARLSGWEPPALEHARILELGCARGGNLLPMAAALPGATLVGVDRSRRQIEEARRICRATALANVTFEEASFGACLASLEPESFDFVICQGVYSWVPIASRNELMQVIRRALRPQGIAYLSFNTLPGWYERLAARDWLRLTAPSGAEPRASLEWLAEHVSPELSSYREQLRNVGARLAETERAYAVHEYLSRDLHPALVGDVLAEASQGGLSYLGDAIPQTTALELLPDAVNARVDRLDAAATQQVLDFVRCTAFRRTLLVRSDTATKRAFSWPARLDVSGIASLRVASRLRLHAPGHYEGSEGSVHVFDPNAQRALDELRAIAPRSLSFRELEERVFSNTAPGPQASRALAGELFDVWLATGSLDFHVFEPRMSTTASARPEACPVARWHAAHGGALTNAWHQEVVLPDPTIGCVLAHADGTRSKDELVRDVQRALLAGTAPARGVVSELVEESLRLLRDSALMRG